MDKYEPHPAAEIFPLLTGAEYDAFKADIAKNGLREPIWLHEGKILDGRNRYRACQDTGTEPAFREYTGDTPIAFVWSLNGERRHLTASQRGAIARKMLPELREEAKKRMKGPGRGHKKGVSKDTGFSDQGRATEKAAEKVGVGNSTVNRVEYVAKRDPELLKKIEAGQMTATEAVQILKSRGEKTPNKQSNNKRAKDIERLANDGNRVEQIAEELGIGVPRVKEVAKQHGITLPDAQFSKSRKINAQRVIEQTVIGLSGYANGLQLINGELKDIDPASAKAWADELSESLKPINRLKKRLQEIANG